ncbi:MAG TPA: FKBP-type peptidyl-prolyl cis-trans isomerase [Chitinophagaceae bacterium]|nr:FKBP-type peptidyl-prolyl cis-trans isomerase [Chitinophagaceae bacterium]HNJ56532.1 FKBP-type peptidyl-prolyl cis-trans isomerase [Chitinophagaceae bacterium]HNL60525.1 FKBP-type peptidyl-prolyl cis-trans isomerase [Chitinophagaceae bacterium]HNO55125.1 FKBP-type peptidyl-prolyl cis-trans isomerase [Chitinophagaceae bacterium]
MKKVNVYLILMAAITMFACNKVDYKKTPSGLLYKIFPASTKDSLIREGLVVKMEATAKINDSVFFSSYGKAPVFLKMQPLRNSYNILEVLKMMKVGDSAVIVQMADTLINRQEQLPPTAKKGDRIVTTLRILKTYDNDSIAMIDYNAAMEKDRPRQEQEQKELMAKAEKEKKQKLEEEGIVIKKWLDDKKIVTQKTSSGAFVQIINPGTGNLIDSGKYVSLNYKGLTFDGRVFDSNTDTAFHHVEPLSFEVDAPGMTEGFNDGVKLLRKGAVAKFYIPSVLAYGGNPNPASGIKPWENLIFEVTVTDVQDKQPIAQPAPETKKKPK